MRRIVAGRVPNLPTPGFVANNYPGDSNGGLLLLLVGAYLLVAYVNGRLGWLTNAINGVWSQYQAGNVTPPAQLPGQAPAYANPTATPARRRTFPTTAVA